MCDKTSALRYPTLICSAALLFGASAQAETVTLIDPANLAIGTKVGKNLEVKGVCPSNISNCLPEEKIKYITAVAGRVGQIEFDVNLTDNFELDVNADWYNYRTITLYKTPDSDAGSLYIQAGYTQIKFNDNQRYNNRSNWVSSKINDIELLAKNGVAYLNINGVPFKDPNGDREDTFTLDTSRPFIKLAITNIEPGDELYEVTLKGGSATTPTPTPTTPTPTTPTTTTGSSSTNASSDSCAAEYDPIAGKLKVPCVLVPSVSGFGSVSVDIFNVQLDQRAGSLTFDLSLNTLKQKGKITPTKQYVANGKTCTDIRLDEYNSAGTAIIDTSYTTSCK